MFLEDRMKKDLYRCLKLNIKYHIIIKMLWKSILLNKLQETQELIDKKTIGKLAEIYLILTKNLMRCDEDILTLHIRMSTITGIVIEPVVDGPNKRVNIENNENKIKELLTDLENRFVQLFMGNINYDDPLWFLR